jgi:chromosome segregation ATPase
MKQLEELELKVLGLIDARKQLAKENASLKSSIEALKATNEKLEISLLDQNGRAEEFEKERNSIKSAIAVLLKNIDALEAAK